jgi:hypothetical protein
MAEKVKNNISYGPKKCSEFEFEFEFGKVVQLYMPTHGSGWGFKIGPSLSAKK